MKSWWEEKIETLRALPENNPNLTSNEREVVQNAVKYIEHQEHYSKDAENCPSYGDSVGCVGGMTNQEWAETVLKWAEEYCGAEVYWFETPEKIVTRPNGTQHTRRAYSSWGLSWKHGIIGELKPKKEQEAEARMMAAMFIYLWLRKVPVQLALDLSSQFASSYKELK